MNLDFNIKFSVDLLVRPKKRFMLKTIITSFSLLSFVHYYLFLLLFNIYFLFNKKFFILLFNNYFLVKEVKVYFEKLSTNVGFDLRYDSEMPTFLASKVGLENELFTAIYFLDHYRFCFTVSIILIILFLTSTRILENFFKKRGIRLPVIAKFVFYAPLSFLLLLLSTFLGYLLFRQFGFIPSVEEVTLVQHVVQAIKTGQIVTQNDFKSFVKQMALSQDEVSVLFRTIAWVGLSGKDDPYSYVFLPTHLKCLLSPEDYKVLILWLFEKSV